VHYSPSSLQVLTPESVALFAKVTQRFMPFLISLFLVAFLDRVNLGFAALTMNADLGISPYVYGWGAGIFFIGYFFFEVPSNLALARFGARVWIARIMITWGLISAATAFARGPASFLVLRFLLGLAEAGFSPGITLFLTYWYPARERARILAIFYLAIPLANIIGAPISSLLLNLNGFGGLHGWQWLFIIEGLPAVVLAFVALGYLTNRPEEASWLSPDERKTLSEIMKADKSLSERAYGRLTLREAFTALNKAFQAVTKQAGAGMPFISSEGTRMRGGATHGRRWFERGPLDTIPRCADQRSWMPLEIPIMKPLI
jgi:MFS transporter, ACS family, tartrate transporter